MSEQSHPGISRRQLLTEGLPRGLAGLARAVLRGRADLNEWAAANVAALYPRPALDPELEGMWRELDEIGERTRREHPDWGWDDLPDFSDRQVVNRYLDDLEARARRGSERRVTTLHDAEQAGDGQSPRQRVVRRRPPGDGRMTE